MENMVATITGLIEMEQRLGPVNGLDDFKERKIRRAVIKQHLSHLEAELREIRDRVRRLPTLPPLALIRWAQAVQALPNLVFLELDTTGLSADVEIIRMVILDAQGDILLESYVKPTKPISAEITRVTGITSQDIEQAPTIVCVWDRLGEALRGKYVLSYNLDFDKGKLQDAAKRNDLEVPLIIGEDLMERAMQYYQVSSYPKLEMLCRSIGHPLPEQPHQTAFDRALGQIALLKAMACAITCGKLDMALTSHATDKIDSDLDPDEHPF
jgi:DNA polymerase III epsilon subunit-like protein